MGQNTASTPKTEPGGPASPRHTLAQPDFAPTWFDPAAAPKPSAEPDELSPEEASARLWRFFMRARVLVASVLLLLQSYFYLQGSVALWLWLLSMAYLAATLAVLRWSRPARAESFWSATWALTLWLDLALFGLLQFVQIGALNYQPLFVLPVLLAAVLGPLRLALGAAACATLLLLFDALAGELRQPELTATYVQGAITGVGLFLVALLVHQLAQRLGREQVQASVHRAAADAQAQVNQLIVTGLSEGVLVLDAHGQIWHANPAACAMLGAPGEQPPYARLPTLPAWPLLSGWARALLLQGQDTSQTLNLPSPGGEAQQVHLRARLSQLGANSPIEPACVIFMENQRDIENRVRNEKLAAMGRVSAALAHEIRNPLAAISQANALLAEEALTPALQRLSTMIGHNAQRLGRTVDDILETSKLPIRPSALAEHLPLDASVAAIVADWQQQHPGGPALHWQPGAGALRVYFEAEHLRRLLVNLLDNAHRHAPAGNATVCIGSHSGPARLEVWNPGPPLAAEVAQHLFEPFNSSRSRSSGLGLYLARQLCQRHAARIEYRPSQRDGVAGNGFVVSFTRAAEFDGPAAPTPEHTA